MLPAPILAANRVFSHVTAGINEVDKERRRRYYSL